MQAIFGILLIIAIYVSYRVSSNKGYSGILFGLGTFLFPILAIIVFALPDKSQAAKRAEIDRKFDESMLEQQRKIDEMSARIRELEKQQQEPAQPEAEAPKQAEPKAEAKPAQPEAEEESVQPGKEEKPLPLNVASRGEMADLIVELEHAKSCYEKKLYSLALPYFEKGAKAGHLESKMYCAQMYYHGQGCDVDFEKALYWYEKAAEQGQVTAQGNCSFMYQEGQGCAVDLAKALYWKEKAAEQGDANKQFELGMMYELGQGSAVNLEKARLWYEKAAAQGHANAQKLLDGMQ